MGNAAKTPLRWMNITAKILVVIWACSWLFYAIAYWAPKEMFTNIVLIAIVVVAPTVLVFFKEKLGAIILLAEGVIILVAYPMLIDPHIPILDRLEIDVLLSLAPLAVGLLLIIRRIKVY